MSAESRPAMSHEVEQQREANAALSRALHYTVMRFVPDTEWPYRGIPQRFSSGELVVRDNIVIIGGIITPVTTTAAVDVTLEDDLREQRIRLFDVVETTTPAGVSVCKLFVDKREVAHPQSKIEIAGALSSIVHFERRRSSRAGEKRR